METSATHGASAPQLGRGVLAAILLELAGSVVAVIALWNLLSNKLDATLAFFGETPAPDQGNVRAYQLWAIVLAAAVVSSLAATLWRRSALAARLWHGFVAAVAIVGVLLFHVALPHHEPVDRTPPGPGCYSGGDADGCPGG